MQPCPRPAASPSPRRRSAPSRARRPPCGRRARGCQGRSRCPRSRSRAPRCSRGSTAPSTRSRCDQDVPLGGRDEERPELLRPDEVDVVDDVMGRERGVPVPLPGRRRGADQRQDDQEQDASSHGFLQVSCEVRHHARTEPGMMISGLWGIHLTGVRDVAAATDHPRARARFSRVLEVADALKQVRYQDLIAARRARQPPAGRRAPAESVACRSTAGPRRATARGTPGYMDTPDPDYSDDNRISPRRSRSGHWRDRSVLQNGPRCIADICSRQ